MILRSAAIALFFLTSISAPIPLLAQSEKAAAQPANETPEPARARLLRTDSPTPFVHRLTLYDHAGQAIDPSDADAKPYSPKMTCGKCHPYAEIAKGWHFNHVGSADVSSARTANADVSSQIATPQKAPTASEFTGETLALPDRPGEPWIYADARLGIQIPLSLRGWPGTFFPAQIGLTAWQFTMHFGRHLSGGGFAEGLTNSASADVAPRARAWGSENSSGATPATPSATATAGAEPGRYFAPATDVEKKRWSISGGLEIDCMMCHATMTSGYDAGEVERQVERQNLRWSATAALGLGLIRGDARSVSNEYDPENPAPPDRADLQLPKIQYEKSKFDGDNRVFFDIARKPPNERCTFCHATRHVGEYRIASWVQHEDVHTSAGLSCSDCHTNDIAHKTVRGYLDEGDDKGPPESKTRSCQGCHIDTASVVSRREQSRRDLMTELRKSGYQGTDGLVGSLETASERLGGIFGSPQPAHAGIPPLHFDILSCTACHSGPWPTIEGTQAIQTALAHALGISTKERKSDAPPEILEPVFARWIDPKKNWLRGRIVNRQLAPHRVHYPSFWAIRQNNELSPLPLSTVIKAAGKLIPKQKGASFEQSPKDFTAAQLTEVLGALKKSIGDGEPVYVRDGQLFQLDAGGRLAFEPTYLADSRPYFWPLAHQVRPAQQSLGVKGCGDCHSDRGAIFAGNVAPGSEHPLTKDQHRNQMASYSHVDIPRAHIWNRLFSMRLIGKLVLAGAILLTGTLLAGFVLRTTGRIAPNADMQVSPKPRRFALAMVVVGALLQAGTTLPFDRPTSWPLLIHSAANPIFIVGLVLWAILWSRSCTWRATPRDWVTWLTLCAGIGVMTTMLLAMLPLFSTDAMRELFAWHKYFGIAVLVGLGGVILLSFTKRAART